MFPFDGITTDRLTVKELSTRRNIQNIVQAIHQMAQRLGLSVTAKGVETNPQA